METAEKNLKKNKVETFNISSSNETMQLATDLAKFIKENKLYQNIQGKEFVNVEAWQYAGARCGIFPIVQQVTDLSIEGEMKYRTDVTLLDVRTGITVGAGTGICSNKENGKKFYQEFAIASMAQTRAIGKAFRNILAWIIRAAGYEPTPAEEMDYTSQPETKAVTAAKPTTAATQTTGNPAAPKAPKLEPVPAPANATDSGMSQKDRDKAMGFIENGDFEGLETHVKEFNITPQESQHLANAVAKKKELLANPEAVAAPVEYATAKQKEEIIRLLNNVVITRQEKTKMLLNINKLDKTRADQSIIKLKATIEERESQTEKAA